MKMKNKILMHQQIHLQRERERQRLRERVSETNKNSYEIIWTSESKMYDDEMKFIFYILNCISSGISITTLHFSCWLLQWHLNFTLMPCNTTQRIYSLRSSLCCTSGSNSSWLSSQMHLFMQIIKYFVKNSFPHPQPSNNILPFASILNFLSQFKLCMHKRRRIFR